MIDLHDLFEEVERKHSFVPQRDVAEIRRFELRTGCVLPEDLKAFHVRFFEAALQIASMGPLYRFVPLSEMRPTYLDILGEGAAPTGTSLCSQCVTYRMVTM